MNRTELLKIAKPILFNAEMVRAIQENRKSVTRMVIKLKYGNTHFEMKVDKYGTRLIEIQNDVEGETFGKNADGSSWHKLRGYIEPKSKYKVGDILYVRETWCEVPYEYEHIPIKDGYITIPKIAYRADSLTDYTGTWRPSIHMPKSAARIFLKITDVRVERLQDITVDGCKAEGIYDDYKTTSGEYHKALVEKAYPIVFSELWNSTIKKQDLDKYGWDANPWVWVYEFERVENNG